MSDKKVYITRKIPDIGIQMLRDKGYEVDVGTTVEAPSKRHLLKALGIKPYDALICFLTDSINSEVYSVCPTIKHVATFSVGYDHIDLAFAKEKDVFVTNTPGTSSLAVAEHTVALMLSLATRLAEGDRFVKDGKYRGWDPYIFVGSMMSGKTVGLLGLGAIGCEVARIMSRGFKSRIIYNDVKRNEAFETEIGAEYMEREEVLKRGDYVSVHVPLMASTKHLINKDTLSLMKNTAFLINTSRGPVVDELALAEAITSGTIRGAGLDVYEFEPKITKALLKLPYVVLTPHIASARDSVRDAMSLCVAKNVISFFETGKPVDIVKV